MSSNELLRSLELLKVEVNDINTFITEITSSEKLIARNQEFHKRVGSLVYNLVTNSSNHKSREDLIITINSLDSYFDTLFRSIQYILTSNPYKVTLDEKLQNIRTKIPEIERYINFKPDDNLFSTRTPYQTAIDSAGADMQAATDAHFIRNHNGGRRIKKRTRRHKKKRGKKTRGKRTRKL
jgi:hypothetical protein